MQASRIHDYIEFSLLRNFATTKRGMLRLRYQRDPTRPHALSRTGFGRGRGGVSDRFDGTWTDRSVQPLDKEN